MSADRKRWIMWAAPAVVAVAIGVTVLALQRDDGPPVGTLATGLPAASDYHSLAVDPANAQELLLGTHAGLYRSDDGGRSWRFEALGGQDAMNLARSDGATLWMAGHDVMAKSSDGGKRWQSVRPSGLPSYDVHGFAADPKAGTLYAAVAGRGLFRSTDGGNSFGLVSSKVGGSVMALAIQPDATILAGDMQRGLLRSSDGGVTWRLMLRAQLMGLAINAKDPRRILASGPGILLSTDGGRTWRQPLKLDQGAGPVAWSSSSPETAYAVGLDRTLYETTDGGSTWRPVG